MRKRLLPSLLCILLLFSFALPVSAAEKGSISVLFQYENKPVPDGSFQLYKAGEWNGRGYSLVSPFSGYSVNLPDDTSSEEWKTLASTLAAYAARDQLMPLASGKTDGTGSLRFNGLSEGLYLLVGETVQVGDIRLFPQPMLVNVPYTEKDGTENFEVRTEPKYEIQTPKEKTVTRRVLKIWDDDGNEKSRPEKIVVQLLRDGEVFDEQTLNEKNGWKHTWKNLDARYTWTLTEKTVPDDYTVQITRQGVTFTVTNTNDSGSPPSDEPDLPHTGLLWWPVPLLAGVGALMLCLGIFLLLRKKERPDE